MTQIHWISAELTRHLGEQDLNEGVDLDSSGAIEEGERTDTNGNGTVETREWLAFLRRNKSPLRELGGFFNYYFSYGQAFLPDSLLHDLLYVESEMATEEQIAASYQKVETVLNEVFPYLSQRVFTPRERLQLVYDAMIKSSFSMAWDAPISLFTQNIAIDSLDCDTASYVALTVAHEFSWPVYLVNAPWHYFVRWQDESGTRFNMDFATQGNIWPDEHYIENYDFTTEQVESGVYLQNHSYERLLATFYLNRAVEKYRLGDDEGAISDYNIVIGFDSKYFMAYINRGLANYRLGNYDEAIADFNIAMELSPTRYESYTNLGIVEAVLGNRQEAMEYLNHGVEEGETYARAYLTRGLVLLVLRNYEDARSDFDRAVELDPQNPAGYAGLAAVYQITGNTEEAARNLQRAQELGAGQ